MASIQSSDPAVVTDHEAFATVVRRLDFASISQQMLASFRNSINGYARLPRAVLDGDIGEIVVHNLEAFRSSTLAGREPSATELEPFRASARLRAAEGMPLEDLLHAYRLGGRLAWQTILETAAAEERDGLLVGAELLMRYIDVVSATVAQAYLDARQLAVSEEERRLRGLLRTLCEEEGVAAAQAAGIAALAGVPLTSSYRPFALCVADDRAIRHGQLAADLRAQGILALTDGDRVSGLLAEGQELHAAAGTLWTVEAAAPRGALTAGLERARLVVDLGHRLRRTGRIAPGEVALELLLASSPETAALLEARVFEPLHGEPGRRADLEQTLGVFLASGSDRRASAEALHIHPNTLDYRLRRIEELTGLDATVPRDLTMLVLAQSQRELQHGADAPD